MSKILLDGSNSFSTKEKEDESPVLSPVVTDNRTGNRGFLSRVGRNLISGGESFKENFMESVIFEFLVPTAKDMMVNIADMAIDLIVYGDAGRSTKSYRSKPYKRSYDEYYERKNKTVTSTRKVLNLDHQMYKFEEIPIEDYQEAKKALQDLKDAVNEYGRVTVSNYCQVRQVEDEFTDNNYGWRNLDSAHVSRVPGGWILNLPTPIALVD